MTTAQQIIDRALRPMRDPDQEFFSPDEMNEYVDEVQRDLAIRQALFLTEETVAANSGALQVADMENVAAWRWVKDLSYHELDWIDPSLFFRYQADNYADDTLPFVSAIEGVLKVLPAPADGQEFVVGYIRTPLLIDDSADAIEVPPMYHDKMVNYVRAQCYYRLDQESLGDRMMGLYNTGLQDPRRAYSVNRPGRPTSAFEMTVFDADVERKH